MTDNMSVKSQLIHNANHMSCPKIGMFHYWRLLLTSLFDKCTKNIIPTIRAEKWRNNTDRLLKEHNQIASDWSVAVPDTEVWFYWAINIYSKFIKKKGPYWNLTHIYNLMLLLFYNCWAVTILNFIWKNGVQGAISNSLRTKKSCERHN